MGGMFKVATILFAVFSAVLVGVYYLGSHKVFGSDFSDTVHPIIVKMGMPWREWFREQLTDFWAPAINLALLWAMAGITSRDTSGIAR